MNKSNQNNKVGLMNQTPTRIQLHKNNKNGAWPQLLGGDGPNYSILSGEKVFCGKIWFAGKVNSQSF
jgi:hypothetical protein